MSDTLPFGSWPSPLSPAVVVAGSVSLGGPAWEPDGDQGAGWLWWSELRPEEQGRVQLVRRAIDADGEPTGEPADVLPAGFSARTRVHEYGGGAWWLGGPSWPGTVFFTSWEDQRLHRFVIGDDVPIPISVAPAVPHGLRFADGVVTPDGRWIICVQERHFADGAEADNEVVALPTDPDLDGEPADAVVLVTGPDFVSSPRVSPDGNRLAWVQWDHPNMPWDDTALLVADLTLDPPAVADAIAVAPEQGRTWMQPQWATPDRLFAIHDPGDRWLLHAFDRRPDGSWAVDESVGGDPDHESGGPQWVFRSDTYCLFPSGGGANVAVVDGIDRLELFDAAGRRQPVALPAESMGGLVPMGPARRVGLVAASFTGEPQVLVASLGDDGSSTLGIARPARDLGLEPTWFSRPRHITFPTTDDAVAHAFFFPPTNPDVTGPSGELPPLLVLGHGGPTGAARPQLQLNIQFWTSRGFAVVDVNYRGSTGYGRAYRDALHDKWGIYDTDDCIAAARFLADAGEVDGDRLAIRGGSAGGYTTLCALTFHDDFAVGSSLYGVADLEALATDTHKFESRYLDLLVGPYPAAKSVYEDRSPIHHTDQLDTPLVIFQGLEDKIVPPAQAEMMVAALRAKGVPFAYLPFEGEQHGFRQAANIRRVLEAELYVFGQILGFRPDDEVEPVSIENR